MINDRQEHYQAVRDMRHLLRNPFYAYVVMRRLKNRKMTEIPIFMRYIDYYCLKGTDNLNSTDILWHHPAPVQTLDGCLDQAYHIGRCKGRTMRLLTVGVHIIANLKKRYHWLL